MGFKASIVFVFTFVVFVGHSVAQQCFISGQCTNSFHIDIQAADDEVICMNNVHFCLTNILVTRYKGLEYVSLLCVLMFCTGLRTCSLYGGG